MIEVSYHDKVNVLQERKLASSSPFERAEWFELLAESIGQQPFVAVAGDNGELAALPLLRSGNRLEPLVNWYSFTWRPLFTPGADRKALLTALARALRAHGRRIMFGPLPDEDGAAAMLEDAFRKAGWIVFREICDSNHVLMVDGRGYGEYLASRPGPLRTTLKRKTKKIVVEISTVFNDNTWNTYETIYAGSWKPEEGDPALLRRFAAAEGVAGRLRLGIARHEGRAVAAQFWTVEAGTAFIHKLAHLEEAQPLSAGSVLTAALMERVLDVDRVETVDFGTGNDSYKRDWMDAVRPRFRLDCHDPADPRGWPCILRGAARRVASRFRAG